MWLMHSDEHDEENAKSHPCGIAGHTPLQPSALLFDLLDSAIQILKICWTYRVISCSSVPFHFHIYTHAYVGEDRGAWAKPYPSFESQLMYFVPQENLTSSKVELDVPPLCSHNILSFHCLIHALHFFSKREWPIPIAKWMFSDRRTHWDAHALLHFHP